MTALLIDGNNLLVRALRATESGRVMLSAGGVPTGALLIFVNCLSRHIREEQPDEVLVAWDGGNSAHRLRLYSGYKANRRGAPHHEDQRSTFALAKEFCTLMGLHQVEMAGYEGDDIIAAHWRANRPLDEPIVILSSDKDFMQLVSEPQITQVRVSSSHAQTDRWDHQRVEAYMGCEARRIPLVMALTGDEGDCVPGVPGYGTKTAVKHLTKADWSLDRLARMYPKVEEHLEQVRLNLQLVNLRDGIPGLQLPPLPAFTPTTPGSVMYGDLLAFLGRYKLDSVRSRYFAGTLWKAVA